MIRITELLLASELDDTEFIQDDIYAIKLNNCEFKWEQVDVAPSKNDNKKIVPEIIELETSKPKLSNLKEITFSIPKGSLVGIVGRVGSGKSSLLNGIIGEMKKVHGTIEISGTIGYCPQQAWIQNASLRDNILFGLSFNQEKYDRAIKLSALSHDLTILQDGDQTEIGEKGINLSGGIYHLTIGQKARVNLARSIYFDPDIVLLDDPLSAIDSHVGKQIFNDCILGLSNKTRLLVTHQLHVIPKCDYIILMHDGKIIEKGNYNELVASNGEFTKLISEYGGIGQETTTETKETIEKPIEKKVEDVKVLMQTEEKAVGAVKSTVWLTYLRVCGGFSAAMSVTLMLILNNIFSVGNSFWLTVWTNKQIPGFVDSNYIAVFWGSAAGYCFSVFIISAYLGYINIKASRMLHDSALTRIMHSPIQFFDSTPLGRILNRFSKDVDEIDSTLTDTIRMFLFTLASSIASFALIIYATPLFAAVIVPLLLVYYFIQKIYRSTARELKRYDAISRSPFYAHFQETLTGLSTIRAYNEQNRFIQNCNDKIDYMNGPFYLLVTAQRWVALRLDCIGALIVFFASVFGVLSRSTISPALLGVSLSYAIQITGALSWCVRQFSEAEIAMNAVERLDHYGSKIEVEAPAIIESNRPPMNWPHEGNIKFVDISIRYRPDLPLVIKGLSFQIEKRQKIAIVGRTGSIY